MIDRWDHVRWSSLLQIEKFLAAYAEENDVDETFEFCTSIYITLFLAYRTKTHDVLSLSATRTVAAIKSVVQLSLTCCHSKDLLGLLRMMFERGMLAAEG